MDSPEKLDTKLKDTQDEEIQNTIRTQYVLDTTIRKQTQIRHEPSYKQMEIKTNRTSFICGNRKGHHDTKVRT
jgi:hypothetical protein